MEPSLLFAFSREMLEIYYKQRVGRSSAELTYYVTLSFFPLLICINMLAALLNFQELPLAELFSNIIPRESVNILTDYLTYISGNQSRSLLIGGLILLVTSSSAAFRSMMNIIDDIYGRRGIGGFWKLVVSLFASILFLLVLYISILILVTGEWFLTLLHNRYGMNLALLSSWRWVRFFVLFAFLLLTLFVFYRMPVLRMRRRPPVVWGALLASAALVVVSILFSWFIGMSSRYQLVYGSLAAVIILMIWLYTCGNILIMGSAFNYVYGKYWRMRRRSS